MKRRAFIKAASGIAAGVLFGGPASLWIARAAAPFQLPPLPYPEDALDPIISTRTIGFHYGKHHRAYVDNLNRHVADVPGLAALSLVDIVQKTAGNAEQKSIFNNAAQAWNHEFYWNSMTIGPNRHAQGSDRYRFRGHGPTQRCTGQDFDRAVR
jgi:Fe-Mn family superoxide dismutase